jgi:hypothetical protein
MAARSEGAHCSHGDYDQQRANKKVGGDEEGRSGVLYPAHIDQGEDEQDGEAEGEGVGFEPGKGRDQRTHTSRDADRRIENVVDHQRGGGQQAGIGPEILRRDRIAAASVRVRVDRLQVGNEDDDQQPNDCEADRHNVLNTSQAQRNKQGERSLWTIRR